jgi:hypothetical protein
MTWEWLISGAVAGAVASAWWRGTWSVWLLLLGFLGGYGVALLLRGMLLAVTNRQLFVDAAPPRILLFAFRAGAGFNEAEGATVGEALWALVRLDMPPWQFSVEWHVEPYNLCWIVEPLSPGTWVEGREAGAGLLIARVLRPGEPPLEVTKKITVRRPIAPQIVDGKEDGNEDRRQG